MSDLQCAARLLLLDPDPATAGRLAHERVAAVYDGQGTDAGDAATSLAATLGVPARTLDVVVTGPQVRRYDPAALQVLREVADLHRGETVVVLAETAAPLEVRVDGDGVVVAPLR